MKTVLNPGENLIKEGSANYMVGGISEGGKLYLTNQRIIFEAHKLNIDKMGADIPVSNVGSCLTGFPNTLTVITNYGKEYTFAVNGKDKWSVEITNLAQQSKTSSNTATYNPQSSTFAPAQTPAINSNTKINEAIVGKLSSKVKTNGIIWIVIAVLQILSGFLCGYWFVLLVGVLNIINGIKDINYSSSVLANPIGIVESFTPLTMPIVTLAYNLFAGGLIGVIGSIYYLAGIRSFVVSNAEEFKKIEQFHINN